MFIGYCLVFRSLLNARSYKYDKTTDNWTRDTKDKQYVLHISSELFEDGRLKYLRPQEWNDDFVTRETIEKNDDGDLPF